MVEYAYDTWGNLLSTSGTMAASLGVDNPSVTAATITTMRPAFTTSTRGIIVLNDIIKQHALFHRNGAFAGRSP